MGRCSFPAGAPAVADCSQKVLQRPLYWETERDVFFLPDRLPGKPCPISSSYQAVRNAAAAQALAGKDRPFSDVVLGYFDWQRKEYERIPVGEQVEVLALTRDIALDKGEPAVHAHVVVGLRDGSTRGGHLIEGHVRPTLEVMLVEAPTHLRKRLDEESGLALIDPGA